MASAANNQLATPEDGEALHHKWIVYVPDCLINVGGLLNIHAEVEEQYSGVRYDERRVLARLEISCRIALYIFCAGPPPAGFLPK